MTTTARRPDPQRANTLPTGGKQKNNRFDPIRFGLATVNKLAGSSLLDRYNLRRPTEKAVFTLTKTGFQMVTAASRVFVANSKKSSAVRPAGRPASGVFDLTPTDEQQMLVEVVREFAEERVRPIAQAADHACETPAEVLTTAAELGIAQIGVPEEAGGLSSERSAVTNVLVAEALAHGDLGIAVAALAPAAVSSALSLWGTAEQQSTYLPAFVGEQPPAAALTLLEPRPGFDPLQLATRAVRSGGGFTLNGVKSLVPLATRAEVFVVAADLQGSGPSLFVIESGTAGLTVEAEPAMGLRAAGMGRLILQDVQLPAAALLEGDDARSTYRSCVRLGRLGWSALALGVGQAVLDYVIPYVNERTAFGEPISHRQAVAFTVADIAIELEGARLVTYRAASRAEQGLDYARDTALARRLASEKGMTIGSNGVQLLGGHGFVKEHPVERWYRDLRAIGLMEGVVLV
jgi:alkylation response protein AidB-like acyl-CoA dehydrogenase